MAVFRSDCGYCKTRHVGFEILTEYRRPSDLRPFECYVLAKCGNCKRAALAMFVVPHIERNLELRFLRALHPSMDVSAPEHVPDSVERCYVEAVSIMGTAPTAAGMTFRKTLEVALKTIRPNDRGNLKNRIDAAAKAGAITEDLAKWAHRIRLDGNEAAHESQPFSSDELEGLHRFTELVLRYLFTLPGMLKAWSADKSSGATTS